MADHSSEIQALNSVPNQMLPTGNTSVGSNASLTVMTGVYIAEITEIRFRSVPLIFRSGAYSREIPIFNRSNP